MYKKIISVMSVALVVFLCTSFPVFATSPVKQQIYYETFYNDGDGNRIMAIYCNGYVTKPRTLEYDYNFVKSRAYYGNSMYEYPYYSYDMMSQGSNNLYEVCVTYNINFCNVTTALCESSDNYVRLVLPQTYNQTPYSMWFECNNDLFEITAIADGVVVLKPNAPYLNYNGRLAFPKDASVSLNFTYHYIYDYFAGTSSGTNSTGGTQYNFEGTYITMGSNMEITKPTTYYRRDNITASYNDVINFNNVVVGMSNLESILSRMENAYNSQSQASQNVASDASSSSSIIDNQHQQESSIYNQTNQAISDTGINNFQFDSNTIGGLGGVKNDFMAVWNSLGTFNSIFITSLTIGLALSIVRHRRMFKQ